MGVCRLLLSSSQNASFGAPVKQFSRHASVAEDEEWIEPLIDLPTTVMVDGEEFDVHF